MTESKSYKAYQEIEGARELVDPGGAIAKIKDLEEAIRDLRNQKKGLLAENAVLRENLQDCIFELERVVTLVREKREFSLPALAGRYKTVIERVVQASRTER